MRTRLFTWLTVILVCGAAGGASVGRESAQSAVPAERHSVWVHPPEVGRDREAVRAFVEQCRRAHIETIIPRQEYSR